MPQGETRQATINSVGTARRIRRMLQARRARNRFLPSSLFGEAAWDMLLEAYAASLEQRTLTLDALFAAATGPDSTSLRWLQTVEQNHLLTRQADPCDSSRTIVQLSPRGLDAMTAYLEAVGTMLV